MGTRGRGSKVKAAAKTAEKKRNEELATAKKNRNAPLAKPKKK